MTFPAKYILRNAETGEQDPIPLEQLGLVELNQVEDVHLDVE
jgi:hypothetical protein